MLDGLNSQIIRAVERDLRRYPDWILRLEASGLGMPNNKIGKDYKTYTIKSSVESSVEFDEEIVRKVNAIENVYYDRLNEEKRKLIDLRYFKDESRNTVIKKLNLNNKNQYYRIRDFAILSFARVLGYLN